MKHCVLRGIQSSQDRRKKTEESIYIQCVLILKLVIVIFETVRYTVKLK